MPALEGSELGLILFLSVSHLGLSRTLLGMNLILTLTGELIFDRRGRIESPTCAAEVRAPIPPHMASFLRSHQLGHGPHISSSSRWQVALCTCTCINLVCYVCPQVDESVPGAGWVGTCM